MSLRSKTATRVGRVRQYPTDLALLTAAALACYAMLAEFAVEGPARLLIAFPLVLFLPGYALVSVLFPARARRASVTTADRPHGIDTVERLGLSFVLSLAIVPVVVMVLPTTEWGLGAGPIAMALAAVTVVLAQLGAVRRLRVPAPDRYVASPRATISAAFADREGTVETASAILLGGAILLAVGALVAAFVVPVPGAEFTQLGLYAEDDDGDLVAGQLPDEIEANESVSFTTTIENEEREEREYTLVVQEQYYEDGEIVERTELETVDATVEAGETERVPLEVTPTAERGETVRISVLLYEGEPPAQPTNDDADEDTYFWITVDEDLFEDEDEDAS